MNAEDRKIRQLLTMSSVSDWSRSDKAFLRRHVRAGKFAPFPWYVLRTMHDPDLGNDGYRWQDDGGR